MREVRAILSKEVRLLLVSSRVQLLLAGVYFISAFFFFYFLSSYNSEVLRLSASQKFIAVQIPAIEEGVLGAYFQAMSLVLLLVLPFLAMDSFVRERKQGDFRFELLAGVSPRAAVLGRFLVFALLCLLLTIVIGVFPVTLSLFFTLDFARVLLSLLGVFSWLIGLSGVCLLICSRSSNAATAALFSFCVLFVLYALQLLDSYVSADISRVLVYLSPPYSQRSFFEGLFEFRFFIYPFLVAALFVSLTSCALWFDRKASGGAVR